jgi:hypothetical protein
MSSLESPFRGVSVRTGASSDNGVPRKAPAALGRALGSGPDMATHPENAEVLPAGSVDHEHGLLTTSSNFAIDLPLFTTVYS